MKSYKLKPYKCIFEGLDYAHRYSNPEHPADANPSPLQPSRSIPGTRHASIQSEE